MKLKRLLKYQLYQRVANKVLLFFFFFFFNDSFKRSKRGREIFNFDTEAASSADCRGRNKSYLPP